MRTLIALLAFCSVSAFAQTDGVTFRRSTGNVIQTNLNQSFGTITNHAATAFRVLSTDAAKKVISLNVTTDVSGDNIHVPGTLDATAIEVFDLFVSNAIPVSVGGLGISTITAGYSTVGNGTNPVDLMNYEYPLVVSGTAGSTRTLVDHGSYIFRRDYSPSIIISNTTSERILFSNTVPANILGTNRILIVTTGGRWLNSTVASLTVTAKVTFGGVLIYEDATAATGTAGAIGVWDSTLRLFNQNASNSQYARIAWSGGSRANATVGVGGFDPGSTSLAGTGTGDATIDTTVDQVLVVTLKYTGGSGTSVWMSKFQEDWEIK